MLPTNRVIGSPADFLGTVSGAEAQRRQKEKSSGSCLPLLSGLYPPPDTSPTVLVLDTEQFLAATVTRISRGARADANHGIFDRTEGLGARRVQGNREASRFVLIRSGAHGLGEDVTALRCGRSDRSCQ